MFSKLSDHLFVTYTRTYVKCPVVSLQFRRLLRAKLRFKLATVTLSDRPCLIKSWSGRCGKGIGKNVKSIAPPLPNPLKPSPRRGDELVVWSLHNARSQRSKRQLSNSKVANFLVINSVENTKSRPCYTLPPT